MPNKHTRGDLQQMQSMSLKDKIRMTQRRIEEWYEHFDGNVYVSFSGGKDSTVLLHLVRQMYPDVPAVFSNTGMELPEIVRFVKTFDNVTILKPKMTFLQIIRKYGYPMFSKEVSECVQGARKYLTSLIESGILDRPTEAEILLRDGGFAGDTLPVKRRKRESGISEPENGDYPQCTRGGYRPSRNTSITGSKLLTDNNSMRNSGENTSGHIQNREIIRNRKIQQARAEWGVRQKASITQNVARGNSNPSSIPVRNRKAARNLQIWKAIQKAEQAGIRSGGAIRYFGKTTGTLTMDNKIRATLWKWQSDIPTERKSGGGTHLGDLEQLQERSQLKTQSTQDCGTTINSCQIQSPMMGTTTTEIIPSDIRKDKSMYSCERYQFMLDAPFEISSTCCSVMKKAPMKHYAKVSGRVPITAQMASESRLRAQHWLNRGCNAFDAKKPISNPMSFWTEQDVLLYVHTHMDELMEWRKAEYRKVLSNKGLNSDDDVDSKTGLTVKELIEKNVAYPLASVYGKVIKENEIDGQLDFEDLELFDLGRPVLKTTGCDRTGCFCCGFGQHHEKPCNSRIQKILDFSNPKLADWMLRGGQFDERGLWVPKAGAGMWFVYEWIGKYGGFKIWYPNREYYIEKYSTPETDMWLKTDD